MSLRNRLAAKKQRFLHSVSVLLSVEKVGRDGKYAGKYAFVKAVER